MNSATAGDVYEGFLEGKLHAEAAGEEAPSFEDLLLVHPNLAGQLRALRAKDLAILSMGIATPPSEPVPGDAIGPYRVDRVVARGGMGLVVRATDTRSGRAVALKTLLPGASSKRFSREVEVLRELRAPGVVAYVDELFDGSTRWLVQEWIDGGTLEDHLEHVSPSRALGWGLQIAETLAEVHARGVYHRDLKPANVMIDSAGRPVLVDFGLARASNAESITRSDEAMGTRSYMAPELLRHERAPDWSLVDVFGLGAILYRCLLGFVPHDRDERGGVEELRIRGVAARSPRALRSSLSAGIDAIVCRAIAPDPRRRYASVENLAADLRRELGGDEPSALRRRRIRRRRAFGGVCCASGIVLVLGFGALRPLLEPRLEPSDYLACDQAELRTRLERSDERAAWAFWALGERAAGGERLEDRTLTAALDALRCDLERADPSPVLLEALRKLAPTLHEESRESVRLGLIDALRRSGAGALTHGPAGGLTLAVLDAIDPVAAQVVAEGLAATPHHSSEELASIAGRLDAGHARSFRESAVLAEAWSIAMSCDEAWTPALVPALVAAGWPAPSFTQERLLECWQETETDLWRRFDVVRALGLLALTEHPRGHVLSSAWRKALEPCVAAGAARDLVPEALCTLARWGDATAVDRLEQMCASPDVVQILDCRPYFALARARWARGDEEASRALFRDRCRALFPDNALSDLDPVVRAWVLKEGLRPAGWSGGFSLWLSGREQPPSTLRIDARDLSLVHDHEVFGDVETSGTRLYWLSKREPCFVLGEGGELRVEWVAQRRAEVSVVAAFEVGHNFDVPGGFFALGTIEITSADEPRTTRFRLRKFFERVTVRARIEPGPVVLTIRSGAAPSTLRVHRVDVEAQVPSH